MKKLILGLIGISLFFGCSSKTQVINESVGELKKSPIEQIETLKIKVQDNNLPILSAKFSPQKDKLVIYSENAKNLTKCGGYLSIDRFYASTNVGGGVTTFVDISSPATVVASLIVSSVFMYTKSKTSASAFLVFDNDYNNIGNLFKSRDIFYLLRLNYLNDNLIIANGRNVFNVKNLKLEEANLPKPCEKGFIKNVILSENEKTVVWGCKKKIVFSKENGEIISSFGIPVESNLVIVEPVPNKEIALVFYSEAGKGLFGDSDNPQIFTFDYKNNKKIEGINGIKLNMKDSYFRFLPIDSRISNDGRYVALLLKKGTKYKIKVYDIQDNEEIIDTKIKDETKYGFLSGKDTVEIFIRSWGFYKNNLIFVTNKYIKKLSLNNGNITKIAVIDKLDLSKKDATKTCLTPIDYNPHKEQLVLPYGSNLILLNQALIQD